MEIDIPVRKPSLADQVYTMVLQGITGGIFPAGSMLPSENQLAERYQVSRPTIRAAFARLYERGYVVRRRGVGTFVADLPSIVNPLYQFLDVFERISTRGLDPGFKQLKAQIIQADEIQGKKLEVSVNSDLLNVHKVFTANGIPIIYFVNYIPRRVFGNKLTDEQAMQPGITEPFFMFFRDKCKHPVKYLKSVIRPEMMQNCEFANVLKMVEPQATVLHVEDIGFDKNDMPIFYSIEYLAKEASSFHVIRQVGNL